MWVSATSSKPSHHIPFTSQPLEPKVSQFHQFHTLLSYSFTICYIPSFHLCVLPTKTVLCKATTLFYKMQTLQSHLTVTLTCPCLYSRKPMTNDSVWPTYTKEHPKYYILNAEKYSTGKGPRTTACAFWNDFLPRLKNQPGALLRSRTHLQEVHVT